MAFDDAVLVMTRSSCCCASTSRVSTWGWTHPSWMAAEATMP
jgi:hypothetical protein